MSTSTTPRQEALAFAARGHGVFPIHSVKEDGSCTCGLPKVDAEGNKHTAGKHPFAPFAPAGFKDATVDVDKINAWFDRHYWLNYGVSTDVLLVIDIDPRHRGDASWQAMAYQPARAIPHTWQVRTGSGGTHIIFKNTESLRCRGSLDRGIDVKAIGGYIVGAGCKHESGGTYQWEPQCSPDEAPLADPPEWLLEVIKLRTYCGTVTPPHEWRKLAREKHYDGERNSTLLRLAGHLISNPLMDPLEARELLIGWDEGRNIPPLGADRVGKVVEDLCARERAKIADRVRKDDWIGTVLEGCNLDVTE